MMDRMKSESDSSPSTPGTFLVRRRAPTLLAGQMTGTRGAIRAWAPDKRRLLLYSVLWAGAFGYTFVPPTLLPLYVLWIGIDRPVPYLALLAPWLYVWAATTPLSIWLWIKLYFAPNALRSPCSLATDEAGISISTRKGVRSLRWSDIVSLQFAGRPHAWFLILPEGGFIRLNLSGYRQEDVNEIRIHIERRVALNSGQSHAALAGAREFR